MMPVNMTITITNPIISAGKMKRAGEELRETSDFVTEEVAKEVSKNARFLLRKRSGRMGRGGKWASKWSTGDLAQSIRAYRAKKTKEKSQWNVGAGNVRAPYAHFVEYGTRDKITAGGKLMPIKHKRYGILGAATEVRGQRGKFYMRDAAIMARNTMILPKRMKVEIKNYLVMIMSG